MLNILFIFCAKYLYIVAVLIVISVWLALPRTQKRQMFIFSIISLPLIYLASRLASMLYFDPRPFVVDHFTPLIAHTADNGFPSDHTLLVSALAVITFPFAKKTASIVLALAVIVGFARVYAGIHHPIDIIGSLVISTIVGLAVYGVLKLFRKKDMAEPEQMLS